MPTSYAHYKFGQKVVEKLPPKYQYFAYEYPEYFYPALHGPDLSFYYFANPVLPVLGNKMHELSGKDYFTLVGNQILAEMESGIPALSRHAAPVEIPEKVNLHDRSTFTRVVDALETPLKQAFTLIQKPMRVGMQPQSRLKGHYGNDEYGKWTKKETEKKMAYMFGFLLHYALDRVAHKYVNEQVDLGTASHFTIEAEFDRMLMVMDGYDPMRHRVTDHIHPRMDIAENIRMFFPNTTAIDMYGCLVTQRFLLNLMTLPGRLPRKLYTGFTTSVGLSKFADLYMAEKPDPRCYQTNEVLLDILNGTVDEGVEFITTLLDRLTGKMEWDDRFNWNFDGDYVKLESN